MKENNLSKTNKEKVFLKNNETIHVKETSEFSEKSFEKFEPIIEEIEQVSNEIEEKGNEALENSEDPSFIKKNQQILEELYHKGEVFLKQVSKELANYPKGIAESFRDRILRNKAEKLREKFFNKKIQKYRNEVKSNKEIDDETKEKAKEKALLAFDSRYKNCLSVFKTIENAGWGNSKDKKITMTKVSRLLKEVAESAVSLGLSDEAFNVLKIYENSLPLKSNSENYSNFSDIIYTINNSLGYVEPEKLNEICRNDPYLIMRCQTSGFSYNKEKMLGFFEGQVDKIIEENPENICGGLLVRDILEDSLKFNPEKYGTDPKNKKYIFEIFKTSAEGLNSKHFIDNFYFFNKEIENLSEEEVTRIIKEINSYEMKYSSSQLFLSSLPLSEKNLEEIFSKLRNYFGTGDEKENFSKELLQKDLENSNNLFIPFFKYKEFKLDPKSRISSFEKIVKSCSSDDIFKFFNKVAASFEDIFKGIPEEEYDPLFQKLIQDSFKRGNVEEIRIFDTLLPEYDLPLKYKEQINQVFVENFAKRNEKSLDKIFGEQKDSLEFSKHEEWLKNKGEFTPGLEIEFYKKGELNQLRHFFFEVIEGKKEAVDKDLLIRNYAERIYDFGAEEFVDLFVVRKKIPMSYSSIFVNKLGHSKINSLFLQLSECVRLEQISKEEYKNILVDLVTNCDYAFADESLKICLTETVDVSKREELIGDFIKNVVKQASVNNSINVEGLMKSGVDFNDLTQEEKKIFLNKFFKEILNYENLHSRINKIIVNSDGSYFNLGFEDKKDREDFIDSFLMSKNPSAINELLDSYFNGIRNPSLKNKYPVFSEIDDKKFESLFKHSLSLNKLEINSSLVNSFSLLPQDKKEILLKNLLAKEDILENSDDKQDIKTFCSIMAFTIEKDRENKEKRNISEEDAENIFSKIFSSKFINKEALVEIMQYRRSFLLENKGIFNEFISTVENKADSYTCYNVLTNFETEEKSILSSEQVNKLSSLVLLNSYLDAKMYQMYLNSTEKNPRFYLDQEIFDKNIKELCRTGTSYHQDSIIDFFVLLKKEKESKEEEKKKITLSTEQEESLGKKILNMPINTLNMERFYDVDNNLFNKLLDEALKAKAVSSLDNLIKTKEDISRNFSSKIINYYFDTQDTPNNTFNNLCDRYSQNPNLLEKIKGKINNISEIEKKSAFKSKLLQKDLLNEKELKIFYEDIRAEKNVNSQALLSAEVLGSLAYRSESTSSLIESESEESKKNIELIRSFVKKYPLEGKGRTIAVMLFAKEYLPERNMGEVIERVVGRLSKYERVLEQFEYKGIPDGLQASIGLEYEITSSTASGYTEITDGRELKSDIVRLSEAAHIGNGRDAVHEIATRPATNPYLTLLEMQILNDLKYIDLNFEYSPEYQKGARGYHLTIGGEKGLSVNANTNFLQNSILAASWGGIHAGETGKRVSGGRGVTLRGRSAGDSNNIKIFDKPTGSVELRSLSVDKMEPFQRSVVTAYHGAIAIQALEKYTDCTSDLICNFYKNNSETKNENEFIQNLKNSGLLKEGYEENEKNMKIVYAWAELVSEVKEALDYHNNEFLNGETTGYLDKDGSWVDTVDFGGNYNKNRFNSVVDSIDPTLSVEEYVNSTKIEFKKLFTSFNSEIADSLTKINNLYLKPGSVSKEIKTETENKKIVKLVGDQANAISMLELTRFDNENIEYRTDDTYLKSTVFDTLGEQREGYYYVQGGSEKMITHACQRALLKFNKKMEEIVKN